MGYLAYYRMFRPAGFDEVVRQEHIVRILKNQIAGDKVGHAYLFCGPRGTGKTTLAKIFARAINCENPQNSSPCGKCSVCRALAEGSNLDISEIDAASNNGVDEMRDLREKVQYPPVAGKYKVYIIDEVHMLTQSAFNAVLKTLEEPPRHAVFILATTEPQKIPATILSRCMRFDFKLIPQEDLESLIKSVFEKTGKEYEDSAVAAIARAGAGSARDSLSIADMCASYSRGKLTYEDVNAVLGSADWSKIADICGRILNEDANGALTAAEQILSTGKGVGVLIKDMLSFLNDCMIVKICKTAREIVNLPDETYKRIEEAAVSADGHKILRITEILSKAETDMRFSANGRITLETAVLKASMPQSDYNIDALIGKINALERKISEGIKVEISKSAPAVQAEKALPQNKSVAVEQKPAAAADYSSESKKQKVLLSDDVGENPFTPKPERAEAHVQPQLFDNYVSAPPVGASTDKTKVFAKFIKALRTTHKNAVLFTLCMDLDHTFEGDKLILLTESEAVLKSINRADNSKFVSEVLSELGVTDYEVRYKPRGETDYEKAMRELKENFNGAEIQEK
ncbi:MAG: DNA polymerase III subunit gamma/tau [Clostridia bacterium]|nr:DNA polymerase III subunit gamma/tau [Clostridia bacterium]